MTSGFSWRARPALPWPFYAVILVGVFVLGIGVGSASMLLTDSGLVVVLSSVFSDTWYGRRISRVAPTQM